MGTDMEWFQIQLALAHWHLDAAVSGAADTMRYHREKAQEVYTRVLSAATSSVLNADQRDEIERRIVALRSRLEPAADSH